MQKCSSGRDSFDVVVDPDGSKSSYRTSKKASNEAAIRPAQILPDDEAVEPFGFIGVCSISMELKTNTEMLHWWWNRHSFFQFKIHTFDDSFVVSVTKETGFDSCLTQNVDLPFTKVVLIENNNDAKSYRDVAICCQIQHVRTEFSPENSLTRIIWRRHPFERH